MEDELEVEVEVLDPAMEQVIDAELSPFNRDELAGIWRSHCHHHDRKQNATQRQTALRWMNNGTGIITFRSACETLELDEEYAKTGLLRHAETRAKPPINREKSGLIFGKYEPCHLSRKKSPSFSSGPQFSTT
jgi:hypothetical protein